MMHAVFGDRPKDQTGDLPTTSGSDHKQRCSRALLNEHVSGETEDMLALGHNARLELVDPGQRLADARRGRLLEWSEWDDDPAGVGRHLVRTHDVEESPPPCRLVGREPQGTVRALRTIDSNHNSEFSVIDGPVRGVLLVRHVSSILLCCGILLLRSRLDEALEWCGHVDTNILQFSFETASHLCGM
jgi:hypothetical protein